MRRYYLQSGLWMSVLTVLILGGLYVAADLNATAPPSNGGTGNQIDDGVTSGRVSGLGTKIAVGVFAKGVTTTVPCPDFDGDGMVGIPDFLQFVDHFGSNLGDGKYEAKYDLDGNGTIGIPDFLQFIDNFGKEVDCGSSSSGGGGNTYGVGDALPNFPSGFFTPRRVSGASFSYSGGRAVLSFNNGGVIELQDGTTYTCIASGGCGVEDGRVTSGTIRVTTGSSGGGGGSSPDLVVDSPSVSDNTLTTGQSFTLSATVRNSGTGSSASTTLRYYQSSDSRISTSDTEVGTDSVRGLSASGTSAESISLNAPSSAGTYYYGACVESVSGESDTNNNCSDGVRVTVSSSSSGGGSGGACAAGLVVNPSGSCTYKGYTFSVSSSGRGTIAFFSAGNSIDTRGSTINGVRWNFYASRNSGSNSWTIHTAD